MTHAAGRIPRKTFTHERVGRVRGAKQQRSRNKGEIVHGSKTQSSRPSIWEKIQMTKPLHLSNPFNLLMTFSNPEKLSMNSENAKKQKMDDKRGLEKTNNSIRNAPQKRNERPASTIVQEAKKMKIELKSEGVRTVRWCGKEQTMVQ